MRASDLPKRRFRPTCCSGRPPRGPCRPCPRRRAGGSLRERNSSRPKRRSRPCPSLWRSPAGPCRPQGAADPGHGARVETGLVGPGVIADQLEARLQGLPVDPHAFDRAGRRPLPAPRISRAPSNAGPVGLDAASSRSRLPSTICGVRPDVHDQVHDLLLAVGRLREEFIPRGVRHPRGRRCTAGDRRGRSGCRRADPARSPSRCTASSVARANGAPPSSVGIEAEDEVVHDRIAHRQREDVVGSAPASEQRSATIVSMQPRIAAVMSSSAPGFIIT